jgi:phage-related protein (TIGR01555 family)
VSVFQDIAASAARAFGFVPSVPPSRALPEPADLPHRGTALERRVDSFTNALTGFGTSGDRTTWGEPDVNRRPQSIEKLRAMVRFNGYAGRIVNFVALEATRKGWFVDDGTDDVDPFRDDDRRLGTLAAFGEADRTARGKGGAVILLVTDDVKIGDFRALERPLRMGAQVKALQVFEPHVEAMCIEWDGDPYSANYRKPLIWHITPLTPAIGLVVGARVHASRTIYVDGADVDRVTRLQNSGFGDSVLEGCYDAIRNKTTHDNGGAILSTELHTNVLKLSNLANLSVSDQADLLWTRLKAMAQSVSMLNTILVGRDEEYTTRAANVTGFADLNEAAKEALATAAGMPMTVLFGTNPGGLGNNDTTGREALDKFIAGHQEARLREPSRVPRLYAARGGEPKSWRVEFRPLDEPSGKELAEIEEINARSDSTRIGDQVLTPAHVAKSRYGKKGYGPILPVDNPDEASEQAKQAEEAAHEAAELAAARMAPPVGAAPGPNAAPPAK